MSKITIRILVAVGLIITLLCLKRSLDVLPRLHGVTSSVGSYATDEDAHTVADTQSAYSLIAEKVSSKTPETAPGSSPSDTLATIPTQTDSQGPSILVEHGSTATDSINPDKIVVMGKTKNEDTSWVAEKLPEYVSQYHPPTLLEHGRTMILCKVYSEFPNTISTVGKMPSIQ